jgi:hypothetical protein
MEAIKSGEIGQDAAMTAATTHLEKAMAALKRQVVPDTGFIGDLAVAAQTEYEQRVDALREQRGAELFSSRLAWEVQLLQQSINTRSGMKADEANAEVTAEKQRQAEEKARLRQLERDKASIRRDWLGREIEMEQQKSNKVRMLQADDVATAIGGFAQLAQAMSTHSKRMFKLYKALAMAEAIVGTAAAIVRTLSEYAFPYSLIMAAGQAAACAAQIIRIQQTTLEGGGGGGGGSTGVSAGSETAAPAAASSRAPAQQSLIVRGGPILDVRMLQELFREARSRNILFSDIRFEQGR